MGSLALMAQVNGLSQHMLFTGQWPEHFPVHDTAFPFLLFWEIRHRKIYTPLTQRTPTCTIHSLHTPIPHTHLLADSSYPR